jgi:hypothetical protein
VSAPTEAAWALYVPTREELAQHEVEPTPAELAIFWAAVRVAAPLGVAFRPGSVAVRWYRSQWRGSGPPEARAWCHTRSRPVEVWIRRGGFSERVQFYDVCHELKHCADALLHPDGWLPPDVEARADAFADCCLYVWENQRAEAARQWRALLESNG